MQGGTGASALRKEFHLQSRALALVTGLKTKVQLPLLRHLQLPTSLKALPIAVPRDFTASLRDATAILTLPGVPPLGAKGVRQTAPPRAIFVIVPTALALSGDGNLHNTKLAVHVTRF